MSYIKLGMIVLGSLFLQSGNISFHLESRTLAKGKVVIIKADMYYKYEEGKMITHYTYPFEYYIISNRKGEAKIYDPKSNTVSLKRGLLYSTDIDMINLFLTGRYSDLGLKDMNFKMASSKKDKEYTISTWITDTKDTEKQQKIELAHDRTLPVYMAIYSTDGKVAKKVYYSDYALQGEYYIPARITEVSYVNKNDSVINKKEYSNFTFGVQATGGYFNFVIPQNAKSAVQ